MKVEKSWNAGDVDGGDDWCCGCCGCVCCYGDDLYIGGGYGTEWVIPVRTRTVAGGDDCQWCLRYWWARGRRDDCWRRGQLGGYVRGSDPL